MGGVGGRGVGGWGEGEWGGGWGGGGVGWKLLEEICLVSLAYFFPMLQAFRSAVGVFCFRLFVNSLR